jgi:hypothetical protein
VARPRQAAIALAKELTSHSLPETGDAFGGRDHTTVVHACKGIKERRDSEQRMSEDYSQIVENFGRMILATPDCVYTGSTAGTRVTGVDSIAAPTSTGGQQTDQQGHQYRLADPHGRCFI